MTIQLGDSYQAQTRFCVIPTASGSFNATASVVFDYNNNSVTQPIGSSAVEVKDIEISAPATIASTTFTVTGTARANSTVKVYEGGTLLGQGKANAAGTWMVDCELADAYNLSTHSVFAEITTPQGNVMPTETKQITYYMNAIQVSKVTMYHLNPEMGRTYESVFDFLNPKSSPTQWIVYYPNKKFTYTVEFTNNDPERISNVVLYVHTADGKFVPCDATYDANKKLWYTEIDMGSSSDNYYPVNCSVDFDYEGRSVISRNEINNAPVDVATHNADAKKLIDAVNELAAKIEAMDIKTQYNEIVKANAEMDALLGLNTVTEDTEAGSKDYNELLKEAESVFTSTDELMEQSARNLLPNIADIKTAGTFSLDDYGVKGELKMLSCEGLTESTMIDNGYESQ